MVGVIEVRLPWLSFKVLGLGVWLVALLIGRYWLGARFRPYSLGVLNGIGFDTEHDRRVVLWQKSLVFFSFGIVAPWLGIVCRNLVDH